MFRKKPTQLKSQKTPITISINKWFNMQIHISRSQYQILHVFKMTTILSVITALTCSLVFIFLTDSEYIFRIAEGTLHFTCYISRQGSSTPLHYFMFIRRNWEKSHLGRSLPKLQAPLLIIASGTLWLLFFFSRCNGHDGYASMLRCKSKLDDSLKLPWNNCAVFAS